MQKPTLLSGIAPSGVMHIGNYLGAISQWVEMQKIHDVFIMVADLHAITVPQEPVPLRENTLRMARLLIACGIDPEQSVLFAQSHVSAHAELAWILNTITSLGELERMTQFKDKGKISGNEFLDISEDSELPIQDIIENFRHKLYYKVKTDSFSVEDVLEKMSTLFGSLFGKHLARARITAGLLNYPVLMAADILLYQTDVVPVGEDQKQHIELTRSLAKRFNNRFGDTFKIPKGFIPEQTARIMGLDDPTKKMSKSAPSANNYIALLDTPDEIRRKIKIAVTDSGREIVYDEEEKPAIANLMRIFAAFAGGEPDDIEKQYQGKSYSDFKRDLGELLVEKLAPLQKRYQELSRDPELVMKILRQGADHANKIAQKTLRNAKQKIGFLV